MSFVRYQYLPTNPEDAQLCCRCQLCLAEVLVEDHFGREECICLRCLAALRSAR
jgi:hypothetical protein